MKIVNVMVLLAASALAGCVGGGESEIEIDEVAKEPQICFIGRCSPPPPVTPPIADDFVLFLDLSSEVGDDVWSTSGPSPQYPNYYDVQVNDLGPVPHETAYAFPTSAVPQDLCSKTTTSGTLYAHDPALGYWYILSTKSKVGVWVPASGSDPAYCDARLTWAIPGSVDSVIISGRSATLWAGSYYDRQITEGVYWYN